MSRISACTKARNEQDGSMISRIVLIVTTIVAAALTLPASADTIKSPDGTVQITVPNGWREGKPSGPAIQVQAVSGRGAIVFVIVVSKEDYKDLKSFANIRLERLKGNMPDAAPKMEDVQLNNKPAIRVSLEGTQANGQRRGYIVTFFETDANYVDVTALASMSVFKAEEETLAGLASQVKILASPSAAAPAAAPTTAPAPGAKPPAVRPPR